MITAVVAVRAGSQRVKNKNIKPFGDSNMLEMKLTLGEERKIKMENQADKENNIK